jgi:hypothetical protein
MTRAGQRKFHYIYKITRNDGSGKYYIGMHSTDDLEDGYFGSGQLLWKSIKKHGKEKHSMEILEFLPSRRELKTRERELVNEEIVNDPRCMNLCLGGDGGFDTLNANGQNLYGKNGLIGFGGENLAAGRTSEANKTRWDKHRDVYLNATRASQQKAQLASNTPLAIEKRKATFDRINHQRGETNSQYGTCWVSNNSQSVKIKKESLDEYLAKGYCRGRKQT